MMFFSLWQFFIGNVNGRIRWNDLGFLFLRRRIWITTSPKVARVVDHSFARSLRSVLSDHALWINREKCHHLYSCVPLPSLCTDRSKRKPPRWKYLRRHEVGSDKPILIFLRSESNFMAVNRCSFSESNRKRAREKEGWVAHVAVSHTPSASPFFLCTWRLWYLVSTKNVLSSIVSSEWRRRSSACLLCKHDGDHAFFSCCSLPTLYETINRTEQKLTQTHRLRAWYDQATLFFPSLGFFFLSLCSARRINSECKVKSRILLHS